MDDVLPVAMRRLHIVSGIVLLGGVFYASVAAGEMLSSFKPVAYTAIGGILVSSLDNFLSKSVYPPHYHMWFGIRGLVVLHVFAATILYRAAKARALTGIVITGAPMVATSRYLRWISLT
jgi:hypothetical protein